MTVMSQPNITAVPEIPRWSLGWRLQRSLAHAGISVEDMAAELGVTRQTIGRWTHDRGEPKTGFVKLWALRCGVPYEWLLTGADVRKQDNRHPAAALVRAA